MSNGLRTFFIIILSILTVAITVLFVKLITNEGLFNLSFGSKESKELIFDKVYENIFDEINISSDAGNVYIEQSNNSDIKVVIYGKEDKSSIDTTDNKLNIVGNTEKCAFICFNHEIARIEVYLPSDYDKNIIIQDKTGDIKIDKFASATIKTTGSTSDITVEEVKDINIKTTTGDIKISKAENADIKTTTGDISINEVNYLDANTTTGDLNIDKINNYLNIETTTGDIFLNDVTLTQNSKIHVTTGDIIIKNTSEFYIDASTSTGDININNNYRTAEFELKIKTTTGDIRVKN